MGINSLKDLKQNREQQLKKLANLANNQEGGGGNDKDDRIWTPHYDKEKKTGYAVVRFLPQAPGEDYPWVKIFRHSFKGPTGKWYIENSLTTIGQPDPLGELNSRLWNSGIESDKDVARAQKRKANYYANVLVLEDKANPENVGKVKLYRFGQKIFEMIKNAMTPQFEDEKPLDPFCPWDGADFVIKIHEESGYPNYGKSYFKTPAPVSKDDETIEAIWKQCAPLSEFLDVEKNFKAYDVLQKRLLEVLGPEVGSGIVTVEGMKVPEQRAAGRAAPKQTPAQEAGFDQEDGDDDLPWNKEDGANTSGGDAKVDTSSIEDMDDFLKNL